MAQPEIAPPSAPHRLRAMWEARVGGIGLVMGLLPPVRDMESACTCPWGLCRDVHNFNLRRRPAISGTGTNNPSTVPTIDHNSHH